MQIKVPNHLPNTNPDNIEMGKPNPKKKTHIDEKIKKMITNK